MVDSLLRRQLRDVASPLWFVLSAIVFIALGVWLKTRLLNWIYGPLFPLFVLYVAPTLVRTALGHARRRRGQVAS